MTGRRTRGRLLDEFVEVTGWERKHANKLLLGVNHARRLRIKAAAPNKLMIRDVGSGTAVNVT